MGYCIHEVVSWYQKKIGTYDKQQWEKTVEQRILSGFTHVPKKTAKLKTELIDVDLVRAYRHPQRCCWGHATYCNWHDTSYDTNSTALEKAVSQNRFGSTNSKREKTDQGSSFTKAKPKHGLVAVTRLAVVRLVLLPVYARWWSQQTSVKMFALLLGLYIFQIVNMFLYSYCARNLPEDAIENVTASEVIIPAVMMLFLCILHSEIVSPHATSSCVPSSVASASLRAGRSVATESSSTSTSNKSSGSLTSLRRVKRVKRRVVTLVSAASTVAAAGPSSSSVSSRSSHRSDSSLPSGARHRRGVTIREVSPVSNFEKRHHGADRHEEDGASDRGVLEDDGFESLNSVGSSDGQSEAGGTTTAQKQNEQQECQHETLTSQQEDDGTWSFYDMKRSSTSVCRLSSGETDHNNSDTDNSDKPPAHNSVGCRSSTPVGHQRLLKRRRGSQQSAALKLSMGGGDSSYNSSDDGGDAGGQEGGAPAGRPPHHHRRSAMAPPTTTEAGTTSAAEWIGITTNSEDCSVSSDIDDVPYQELNDHPFASEFQSSPSVILSPSCAASDKVSCTMWEKREVKKAELSVLDISSAIIARVEGIPENLDYFYGGMLVSIFLGMVPSLYRLTVSPPPHGPLVFDQSTAAATSPLPLYAFTFSFYQVAVSFVVSYASAFLETAFGDTVWERSIAVIALVERTILSCLFFFLIAIAERTFKQRFLYAKFFSHLTSFRRARKSELPHFRLNKVRNIKTWLSVRSYLKKRGPQHSVDVIVSSVFLITLLLLSFLSVELLKDSERLHSMYNIEALVWCIILGLFLLRFMTLGTKINRKYRNLSVLITEQINLYLQIEQKPNKKEELMVANSVLKLAADLLKELECPYKISGLSANPYLYTITKVVILSALSGVLSEMLGFKLKLHKIKIK